MYAVLCGIHLPDVLALSQPVVIVTTYSATPNPN
jgi:hypothetical protein